MPGSDGQLRGEVRAFLRGQRFEPHCHAWMTEFDPAFSRALGRQGWIGMTWPLECGGGGRPERERLAVIEELLAAGAPVAAHWIADRQTGPALLRYGTPDQCRRYLPPVTRGECFFAIGMSEPDSGSDLASVRTAATATADGWRVTGRKVWTGHAHQADYLLALVRTAPRDSGRRHAGLTQLIIDLSAAGVTVRPLRSLDGGHHFNEVTLDDVPVPRDALLGREGAGWEQVTAELAYERSGPERFLSTMPLLRELARRRAGPDDRQIGGLIAELQTLRALSAMIADALEGGAVAGEDGSGVRATPAREAAMVKDLGTRFELKVIDVARELLDTEPALDSPDPLSRLLAEAVLHGPDGTLRGGTTEILRGIVARQLVAP
ncbi:MAG TPA: acyl-CoA dehydrogenase family protein [Streptosporangiaceae bacterium]|jgi:alkylation response protein AidB-like acyl-CoA dehydrogenase